MTPVERFIADAPALEQLIAPLSKDHLMARPIPGTWSLQELVIHVMESDLIATHRMKRIIAEENPLLISYDENLFVKSLYYHDCDVRLCAQLFRLNRLQMGEILHRLPPAAFERCGVHNVRGKVSLKEMVAMYADHVEHHLRFAREKLKALALPVNV